jgi:hypothetical protein
VGKVESAGVRFFAGRHPNEHRQRLIAIGRKDSRYGMHTAACGRIRPSEFKVSFVQQAYADEARRCNRDIRAEAYLPSPNDALKATAKPLETIDSGVGR